MKDIIEGNKIEWEEDFLNNMVEYVNNNYESLEKDFLYLLVNYLISKEKMENFNIKEINMKVFKYLY